MSTEAFGARRVRESLRAIGTYLDSASRLAEGVPAGETVRLDLDPPGPRLFQVQLNGSSTIELPDPQTSGGPTTLTVSGEGLNLSEPKRLTLMRVAGGVPPFSTDQFDSTSDDRSFSATIIVSEPSHGVYDAQFVNKAGQTFLLSRAVHIKAAHAEHNYEQPQPGNARKAPAAGAQAK